MTDNNFELFMNIFQTWLAIPKHVRLDINNILWTYDSSKNKLLYNSIRIYFKPIKFHKIRDLLTVHETLYNNDNLNFFINNLSVLSLSISTSLHNPENIEECKLFKTFLYEILKHNKKDYKEEMLTIYISIKFKNVIKEIKNEVAYRPGKYGYEQALESYNKLQKQYNDKYNFMD